MKAIQFHRYGSPEVLQLEDLEMPTVADEAVLVRVKAASVNALDWHRMRGQPVLVRMTGGFRSPKTASLGVDASGVVEAVGKDVTHLQPGDEVYGVRTGAFGEYVSGRTFGLKPANFSFEQAAAMPVAAVTALQGLRDKGRLQAGQCVLVNGASGGVGHFAVQIAKALGAEVTGVTSTGNVEMVRSLGADHVVDYTREDFTKQRGAYDLVFDVAGSRSLRSTRRVLAPTGTFLVVGGPAGRVIQPMDRMVGGLVMSRFVSQRVLGFIADVTLEDLAALKGLAEAGKLTPAIDRTYSLDQVPEAMRYVEQGHTRGKVVITI
jgi:NADPH:quinone reductase-like Zn-dependent oxidoreductase